MKRLILGFVLLTGCKVMQGERCQVTQDCAEGLLCVIPPGGSIQSGGICQPPDAGDMTVLLPADLAGSD